MLSLHKKKRMILSALVVAAIVLPAMTFAIKKLTSASNTFARTYEIPTGYTRITDPNFYDCVVTKLVSSGEIISADGPTDSQLAGIDRLVCNNGSSGEKIVNTTGLEVMTGLDYLDLGSNEITSIDLSNNTLLNYLDLHGNQISNINLSQNTALSSAYLYSNQLSSIDVTYNTSLTRLDIFSNQITSVDLSHNTALMTIQSDEITINTGVTPTKDGNDYVYDLSSLRYLKNGGHGPETVTFTTDSGNEYDGDTGILTIHNTVSAARIIGDVIHFSYTLGLPYVLDFDLAGGMGSFDTEACYVAPTISNCSVTLPSTEPTRDGYHFAGWAESSTAMAPEYRAGDSVTLSGNKTLYAMWEVVVSRLMVAFDLNGGEGDVIAQNCSVSVEASTCNVTVPDTEPTRRGYIFMGWAESATASEAAYHAGDTVTISTDKTLYAVWDPVATVVRLILDSNGSETVIEPVICSVTVINPSCSVTVPNTRPTRSGYSFLGWADSSTATTTAYRPGDSITLSENKTIYAVWDPVVTVIRLSLDPNGAETVIEPVICSISVENPTCNVVIPNVEPTRSGYTFLGWADSASAKNPDYQAGGTIALTNSKTIYAIWSAVGSNVTLSYNLNGGDGLIASQTCSVSVEVPTCSITLQNVRPGKGGYTFSGWADSETATTADYQPGDSAMISADKTIYAVWRVIITPVNITIDPNYEEGTTLLTSCTVSALEPTCEITLPNEAPTREGYEFLGWADDAEATEPDYELGGTVTLSADKTIYAIWKEAEEEPDEPTPSDVEPEDDEEEIPVPNTGMNTRNGGSGAVFTIAVIPVAAILTVVFIRHHNKEVEID